MVIPECSLYFPPIFPSKPATRSAFLRFSTLHLRPLHTHNPPACPRSQPVLCPRHPLPPPSPFLPVLRGLGELIVRVVYVTVGPSGRVECTSSVVTYPHRRRAAVHRTGAAVLSHLLPAYLNLRWASSPIHPAADHSGTSNLHSTQRFLRLPPLFGFDFKIPYTSHTVNRMGLSHFLKHWIEQSALLYTPQFFCVIEM